MPICPKCSQHYWAKDGHARCGATPAAAESASAVKSKVSPAPAPSVKSSAADKLASAAAAGTAALPSGDSSTGAPLLRQGPRRKIVVMLPGSFAAVTSPVPAPPVAISPMSSSGTPWVEANRSLWRTVIRPLASTVFPIGPATHHLCRFLWPGHGAGLADRVGAVVTVHAVFQFRTTAPATTTPSTGNESQLSLHVQRDGAETTPHLVGAFRVFPTDCRLVETTPWHDESPRAAGLWTLSWTLESLPDTELSLTCSLLDAHITISLG